jgi:activator of HSP90 ATPase
MMENSKRPVGLTKDAGYQIGVRRTLPIRYEDAWRVLTSSVGVNIWLGSPSNLDFTDSAKYELSDGTVGEIRVFSPNSHLRITWQPQGWSRASTIQLRVIPKGDKTVVAFHQEHLPGLKERSERREHYKAALENLERITRPV